MTSAGEDDRATDPRRGKILEFFEEKRSDLERYGEDDVKDEPIKEKLSNIMKIPKNEMVVFHIKTSTNKSAFYPSEPDRKGKRNIVVRSLDAKKVFILNEDGSHLELDQDKERILFLGSGNGHVVSIFYGRDNKLHTYIDTQEHECEEKNMGRGLTGYVVKPKEETGPYVGIEYTIDLLHNANVSAWDGGIVGSGNNLNKKFKPAHKFNLTPVKR